MKKINIILVVLTLAIFAGSCETYDDYNADRTSIARFHKVVPRQVTPPFETNKIEVTVGGSDLRVVELFVSDKTNVERTFNVVVVDELTTVASENFSFNSTVVVPANERSGLLTFNVTDVSLTRDYEDVAIAIQSVDGEIIAGVPFVLELRAR